MKTNYLCKEVIYDVHKKYWSFLSHLKKKFRNKNIYEILTDINIGGLETQNFLNLLNPFICVTFRRFGKFGGILNELV